MKETVSMATLRCMVKYGHITLYGEVWPHYAFDYYLKATWN